MKVLTIREPYVSPIAQGLKHYETRSWSTNYRGEIYIHTAKSTLPEPVPITRIFPLGSIVIKARLTDCILMDDAFIASLDHVEKDLGFYERGRYAWKLEAIEIIEPVPAKGSLGIWNYGGE